MTTDDTITDALSDLTVPAPASLRPAVLVEVGLIDRIATIDSPIGPLVVAWNGRGVSMVDLAGDDDDVRTPPSRARPDAGPSGPSGSRRASRRRSDAAWTATGACASTSTCAVGRRSSATSGEGARDPAWRGPAVRLDRRRDRSAEGGPGGRARRSATTRSRSSCPAIGWSARTARSASTRSAARRTSGRSWRAEGLDPDAMESMAAAGQRYLGSRHDPHRVPADVPQREAHHDPHRVPFRSLGAAVSAGYRPCQVCRPDSGAIVAAA